MTQDFFSFCLFLFVSVHFGIGDTIPTRREIQCLPYVGFLVFISKKRQNAHPFCTIDKYGGFRWIGIKIIPHFDLLMFEISLLEAEKTECSNVDQITQKKCNSKLYESCP